MIRKRLEFRPALMVLTFLMLPLATRAQSFPDAMDRAVSKVSAGIVLPNDPADGPRPDSQQHPTDSAAPYTRPTQKERFKSYLYHAYGPSALISAAFAAGIRQAENKPPDWGQGAAGYGSRLGSAYGQSVIKATTIYSLGTLLGEDTRFYRCDCQGFFPRFKHAVLSTLSSRKGQDGHYVFSVPKLLGPYAGGMGTLMWYPARFGPKDGFRAGNVSLGLGAALNVAREFIWAKL